jgi:pilus assembly protein CpaB
MKIPREFLMITASVIIGLGAVSLASHWILKQSPVDISKVVVAAQDIDLGTPLTPQMLKVADWTKGSVPAGATQDVKKLDTRVVKTSMLRGEPILESKLAPLGSTGGLSAVIAKGNRAMTVRVNDVVGVAGFALPGNYVDIVVNTEDETVKADNVNRSISKIVLARILVLAVAQEQMRDDTKPKVVNAVTLEVSPEQAEKLDLARSVGSLSLVLRNQMDTNLVTTSGSTKKNLFNRVEKPVVALAQAEVKPEVKKTTHRKLFLKKSDEKPVYEQVEVVRGTVKTIEEFKR